MKRHWLRGILLGVSLAMLLASGVALAQGLFFTVDKECVECWPGEGFPTDDRYLLGFTVGGWNTNYDLCVRTTIDGVLLGAGCHDSFPPEDPFSEQDFFLCDWIDNRLRPSSLPGGDVSASNGPPSPLGQSRTRAATPCTIRGTPAPGHGQGEATDLCGRRGTWRWGLR